MCILKVLGANRVFITCCAITRPDIITMVHSVSRDMFTQIVPRGILLRINHDHNMMYCFRYCVLSLQVHPCWKVHQSFLTTTKHYLLELKKRYLLLAQKPNNSVWLNWNSWFEFTNIIINLSNESVLKKWLRPQRILRLNCELTQPNLRSQKPRIAQVGLFSGEDSN